MNMRIHLELIFCVCTSVMAPLCHGWHPGVTSGDDLSSETVERWYREVLPYRTRKLTKIHFYVHEIRVANVPNTVKIAGANTSDTSPTHFGATFAFDYIVTTTADPRSQLIGQLQGVYSSASQEQSSFILTMNVAFTGGKFNGSSIAILGRDPIAQQYREYPILGGSGVFRLARGSVITRTYSLEQATLNAIVEYTLLVEHY